MNERQLFQKISIEPEVSTEELTCISVSGAGEERKFPKNVKKEFYICQNIYFKYFLNE